jgi:hypothetical protein
MTERNSYPPTAPSWKTADRPLIGAQEASTGLPAPKCTYGMVWDGSFAWISGYLFSSTTP